MRLLVTRPVEDAARTAELKRQGWRVMRFWNPDVLADAGAVAETILAALPPSPPR